MGKGIGFDGVAGISDGSRMWQRGPCSSVSCFSSRQVRFVKISFLFFSFFFLFFFFFIERKSRLSDKPWREGIGDGTIVRSCRSNCRARVCFITVYRFLELYIN